MNLTQTFFGKIFLIVFISIFIQVIYKGIFSIPSEGDSVDYHIPIAHSFLTGNIFNPTEIQAVKHTIYYPANGEGILSLFILTGLPLGLFNALGIFVLLLICIRLGTVFKLTNHTSIIFAVTVCTLNIILRWSDTQIIDIWLLNFFLLSLLFLETPKKTSEYFFKLGISLGLLIGMKFSGPFIALVLLVFYSKKLWPFLSVLKVFIFLVPVFIFGASWFIRNIYWTGNPFFPQAFLFFEGGKSVILNVTVWKVITGSVSGAISTLNSLVSEFLVWTLIIPFSIIMYFRQMTFKLPVRLLLVSLVLFLLFLNLPSANKEHIMTSSFRYFLPSIVPLILFAFLFFEKIKKTEVPGIVSLTSLLLVEFPFGYFPKLFFFTVPAALYIYFFGYDKLIKWSRKLN